MVELTPKGHMVRLACEASFDGKVALDGRGGRLGAGAPQDRICVVFWMEIVDQIYFRSDTRPLQYHATRQTRRACAEPAGSVTK